MTQFNNPNSVYILIKDFESIIGTLFGVILGSILGFFSQKLGHIYFQLDKWDIAFYHINLSPTGEEKFITIKDDFAGANIAKYTLEADIFNSFNISKGLRGFRMMFIGKSFSYEHEPTDSTTWKHYNSGNLSEKLKILTLFPNHFLRIKIEGSISENLIQIAGCQKILLKALDHKNKVYKWKIIN